MPTAHITGGHSGIGYSCARHLATHYKWDLILAGRSPDKMNEVADELRREASVNVTTLPLDTSSIASVRAAAAQCVAMLANGDLASLDALLCNAGGRFDDPVAYSGDGYEVTFASNCLGHFLLTCLIADHMVPAGRIVFTASGTHDPATTDGKFFAVVDPDAVVLANVGKDGAKLLSAGKRYSTSKLCNVLNAYELHRRLRRSGYPIASMAFDPGSTPNTGFFGPCPNRFSGCRRRGLWDGCRAGWASPSGRLSFPGPRLPVLPLIPSMQMAQASIFNRMTAS